MMKLCESEYFYPYKTVMVLLEGVTQLLSALGAQISHERKAIVNETMKN